MLKVAVRGANRSILPRRDENAHGRGTIRMHVEEAENLGFREAERMDYGSRLELAAFGELHNRLHAYAPVIARVPFGKAKLLVKNAPDGTDRSVSDNCEACLHIHSWHIAVGWRSVLLYTLIRHAYANDLISLEKRFCYRRPWPYLSHAGLHHLAGRPPHEGSHVKHKTASLVHERRCERKLASVELSALHDYAACFEACVDELSSGRTLGTAEMIEKIRGLLARHICGIWNILGEIDTRERAADRVCLCDDSGNAKARIIRALVAHHLKRHAGHHLRLVKRCTILFRLGKLRSERKKESCGGRTKARHHNVCFHYLTVHVPTS